MNLKHLSDDCLLRDTENLAREEREILLTILHHLREIERRRLFSALQFNSLFDYAVKKLGYSEDQACRRIAAMRLLKEIPEIEEKINSGALSLTHIGLAQSLFRKEEKAGIKEFSKDKKIEVLNSLEGKSTREAAKAVWSLSSSPTPIVNDKIKAISAELIEVRFTADENLQKKIEKLKGHLAHTHPDISLAELFNKLCDLGLEKWDRSVADQSQSKTDQQSDIQTKQHLKNQKNQNPIPAAPQVTLRKISSLQLQKQNLSQPQKSVSSQATTKISQAEIRRQVWQRDQGRCQNCGSIYAIEIDHIIPQAKGGDSNLENLRLLCRSCNQRAAIEHFGPEKMEKYL